MILRILIFMFVLINLVYAQSESGNISISTNRNTSEIIINDSLIFHGSVSGDFEFGTYSILVKEESAKWGSEVKELNFILNEVNPSYTTEIIFKNKTFLDSNPTNASVYHNDSLLGFTPLLLKTNSLELNLSKHGFYSKRVNLNTDMGIIELERENAQNDKNFLETYLIETLIGSAISLGVAAAYYKIKADDKYDEYLSSRDKTLLDQTEKYDLISGIAFGILQINFGALIYLFLTND